MKEYCYVINKKANCTFLCKNCDVLKKYISQWYDEHNELDSADEPDNYYDDPNSGAIFWNEMVVPCEGDADPMPIHQNASQTAYFLNALFREDGRILMMTYSDSNSCVDSDTLYIYTNENTQLHENEIVTQIDTINECDGISDITIYQFSNYRKNVKVQNLKIPASQRYFFINYENINENLTDLAGKSVKLTRKQNIDYNEDSQNTPNINIITDYPFDDDECPF